MNLTVTIIVIAVGIGVFFLLREVWCWFWEINERNRLLTEISEKLDRLVGKLATGTAKVDTSIQVQREKVQRRYADNEPIGMEKIEPKAPKPEKPA